MKESSEIKRYVTHAERFGVEGVMEAARDEGCTLKELEALLVKCDQIEFAQKKKAHKFASPVKHRLTAEQRVKRLCGIEDETEEDS